MISEDYQLINNEYVKRAHVLKPAEIEGIAETDIVPFFRSLDIDIKRISRAKTKTVDYEFGNVGLEVTVMHDYLPRYTDLDDLLDRHVQTNSRICAYMYMKDDQPKIEILNERELDKHSILCLSGASWRWR